MAQLVEKIPFQLIRHHHSRLSRTHQWEFVVFYDAVSVASATTSVAAAVAFSLVIWKCSFFLSLKPPQTRKLHKFRVLMFSQMNVQVCKVHFALVKTHLKLWKNCARSALLICKSTFQKLLSLRLPAFEYSRKFPMEMEYRRKNTIPLAILQSSGNCEMECIIFYSLEILKWWYELLKE